MRSISYQSFEFSFNGSLDELLDGISNNSKLNHVWKHIIKTPADINLNFHLIIRRMI